MEVKPRFFASASVLSLDEASLEEVASLGIGNAEVRSRSLTTTEIVCGSPS